MLPALTDAVDATDVDEFSFACANDSGVLLAPVRLPTKRPLSPRTSTSADAALLLAEEAEDGRWRPRSRPDFGPQRGAIAFICGRLGFRECIGDQRWPRPRLAA